MSHAATDSASVVSPNIYSLIATSPRLRRMLLPEGILASPYEVLDYDATLTLGDTKGIKADFQRTETVRFLQSGVAGILDHVWGDGVALTYYHNEAGNLEDSFNDQGRCHLVIGFKRAMRRGETMKFDVMRTAWYWAGRPSSRRVRLRSLSTTVDNPHLQRVFLQLPAHHVFGQGYVNRGSCQVLVAQGLLDDS